jgi:ribosomal-protein-alanine N-acetyltransferase
MALAIRIRSAQNSDADALLAIENECFSDSNWAQADFFRYDCLVAETVDTGEIAGFLVSRQIAPGNQTTPPEREILNLAISKGFRRNNIAKRLLAQEFVHRAATFLEVRESNVAARRLYQNLGFEEIGIRAEYYENPVESAIVMRMKW